MTLALYHVFWDWLVIYRGSYMRAHVLLNLSDELGKRDKTLVIFNFVLSFTIFKQA